MPTAVTALPLPQPTEHPPTAILVGVDTHKAAHVAVALTALGARVAPGYVNHNPFAPPGRAGVKTIFGAFLAAFSDFRVAVEDALVAGDRVVGRFTYTGVHTGPFLGYAPTGRPVVMRSIDVWRVGPDGRFVEHWDELNTLDSFQQIGAAALTAPPLATPAGGRADG